MHARNFLPSSKELRASNTPLLHAREMAASEINSPVLIYDISYKVRSSMLCVEMALMKTYENLNRHSCSGLLYCAIAIALFPAQ
jgi:hypothetical protein